ncbi:MAG TPA: tetratricopeptide repeat protein [Saprospiraceae bacterium]|nr:tetratricopeptide repeat protein [Saprospiraceae bacterium]
MKKDQGKKKGNIRPRTSHTNFSPKSKPFGSNLDRMGLAAILVLGTLIYTNSFDCTFHLDDLNNLRDNPAIRNVSDLRSIWQYSHTRFVAIYSFAWNYHFGQLHVWGYHLVNLTIHLINAILVYWLSFLIFSSPVLKGTFMPKDKTILALAVAGLFVSHPLATQSVTYIVQRMTSMSAMFYLLSLILYLRSRLTHKGKRIKLRLFIGALISALLAILTKENAFTIPFAIILLEIFFLQTKQHPVSFKNGWILPAGAGLVFLIILGFYKYSDVLTNPQFVDPDMGNADITAVHYLLTQFSVILKYIQLLIVPVNQVFDYNYKLVMSFLDPRAWASFLVLAGLIALAIFLFNKHRIISFGIFWFFLTLAIESSIIPLQDLIFEHRTYLPSFGFFLLLVYIVYLLTWPNYKSIGIAIMAILIVVNSVLAYRRNKVWQDEVTLCTDSIQKSPDKARPYNNRGDALVDQNKLEEAFSDFNKAIELHPKYSMAYYNRGNVFEKQKKYDQAIADYNAAIRYRPDFDKAFNNRGTVYKELNRLDEAMSDYDRVIALNPSNSMVYNNRGTIYILQSQYQRAIEELNKAIALKHDFAEAFGNRGIAELKLGNAQEGCMDIKKAADLGFAPAGEFYRQNCQSR